MNVRFNYLSACVLCLGLVVGCSSSNNAPEDFVADNVAENNDETIDLNGDYDVAVSLSEASSAVPECEPAIGTLNVTGTTITGVVDNTFTISGTIAGDGTITGGFAIIGDDSTFASYDGALDGEALAGTWADIRGCAGTWRATRVII